MIMQSFHHVVDCPTCGRPVEIEADSLGREMACSHCRGRFVVYQSTGQRLITATIREHSMLERANRILRTPGHRSSESQTVILVDHRDEVYARLAADLKKCGAKVVRAESVEKALRLVSTFASALVVANRDLPTQNGWVLADKLSLIAPYIEVWLYMPQTSAYAEVLANFLKVTQLLAYEGDLFSLSDSVMDRFANRRKSNITSKDSREMAAA